MSDNADNTFNVDNNNDEARQILNTPLSCRLSHDSTIWNWDKDNIYSVRSVHHLIKEAASKDNPEASSSNDQILWIALWKIKTPQSVQNFLRRLGKDILPTRSRLNRKGMHIDTICPLGFEAHQCLKF